MASAPDAGTAAVPVVLLPSQHMNDSFSSSADQAPEVQMASAFGTEQPLCQHRGEGAGHHLVKVAPQPQLSDTSSSLQDIALPQADIKSPIDRPFSRSVQDDGEIAQVSVPSASLHASANSHIENLMEQQNQLMLRQLELAEESHKQCEISRFQFVQPTEFLKSMDPQIRTIFTQWRKEFRMKVQEYVAQMKLSNKQQMATDNGKLIKPFCDEVQKQWQWGQFYCARAKPIAGIDPLLANGVPAGMVDSNDNVHAKTHCQCKYDIHAAFLELRQRHAQELQRFVIAHQKISLNNIIDELTLSYQMKTLEERLAAWAVERSTFCNPLAKQHLERQSKHFVELVYSDEMSKAEESLKNVQTTAPIVVIGMRIICMIALLLMIVFMDHALLTRLFAILFATGCGLVLLWEDAVLRSLRLLLGRSSDTRSHTETPQTNPQSLGMHMLFGGMAEVITD